MSKMRWNLAFYFILLRSHFVIGSAGEGRDCHGMFMRFMNQSIAAQSNKPQTAAFSCSDPEVMTEPPGTRSEHWDAWQIAAKVLYYDGGADFPNGVLFTPEIGGFPVPTGAAREYFTHGVQGILNQLKQQLPNLCTKEGEKQWVKISQADYEKHRHDFKEYAEENCDAFFRSSVSLAGARNLLSTGSKAIIKSIPEMAKWVPSLRVRAALAEVAIAMGLDAQGDTLV